MLLGLGSQAQGGKGNTVNDTTEVVMGHKVITITYDTLTGKKDVTVKSFENATSEDDADGKDSSEIKPVKASVLGLDLGLNWLMADNRFQFPASESDFETEPLRSSHFALHLFPSHFSMAKGKVSLLTAITLDNVRYQFRNNVTFAPNQPRVTLVDDSVSLRKNKLNIWYGQIPLMLSLQTNPSHPKRNFHIAVGGYAGLLLGASSKQKSEERGKVIRQDDYNLEPLRYGLSARIGYGILELYTNYTLSDLFQEGQAPAFNNINFGISLTGML
jgi:hypothetical protein